MNILVTGTRAPCAAELVGILRRSELGNVLGADSCSWTLVPSLRLPAPNHGGLAYAQAVVKLCKEYDIDLVWPTCEEAFHLAKHRSELPCPVFCPDSFVLDMLHNKRKFAEFGRHLSPHVTTPSETEMEPCVWKKPYSRFGCGVRRSKPGDQQGWFTQEWVDGEEFSSMIICRGGEVLLSISYKAILRCGGVAVGLSCGGMPSLAGSGLAAMERHEPIEALVRRLPLRPAWVGDLRWGRALFVRLKMVAEMRSGSSLMHLLLLPISRV